MSYTRRNLLHLGAASALAPAYSLPGPRIRKFEVFPVIYPVRGRFKFFPEPERPTAVVKLTAEDGTVGWGQTVPVPTWSYETLETAVLVLEKYLAPAILGRDPFDLAGAHQAMNKAIAPGFSTGMPVTKAGVDLALHDLIGKLSGKSVAEMWGRTPLDRIALSWTVNATELKEVDELVEAGKKAGYRNFNVKVAPDPRFDVKLCRRVKQLAPDTFLWADANGGYDLETALAVAPRLRDAGVNVLEQPIPPNRLTGLRELKKQGALPIILDEGVVNSAELEEFIKLKMLDGVAMKPGRTAGLFDARRQVEIVLRENLLFLGSGICDPDLSLAASLQLFAGYGLERPAALNGPQFLSGSVLKSPIVVKNGMAATPKGPGLGVTVNEAALRRPMLAAQVAVPSAWVFENVGDTSVRLARSGKPVYVYNYGMMLAPGAPEERRRSSYLHPVYAPNGVAVTDDFPRDHYHHRGISWMWPVVIVDGVQHDHWMVKGIQTRFVRWLARETKADSARLAVENGWFTGDRKVLREEVEIVADAAGLALRLVFDPLVPLRIGGTQEAKKGYGGLSFRFAPRQNTVITTDKGKESKDSDLVPHAWAELAGDFAGGHAAARVDIDPSNPAFPNGWCLRHYGFLGVNYPGLEPVELKPGKPLVMKYRVALR